ncbi:MAG: lipid-A-disaccharide synthase [Acidobacteriota bacterium]|nr:MAG: lipid-A-disaccharide synthase [Acidobacteriota bacterium]
MKPLRLLISCGEASGDLYAAELLKELIKKRPSLSAFGLGGARAEAAGMERIVRLEEVSVIGLVEVVRKLPALSDAMRRLCTAAETRRPDLAVLIDFSGFNLRLARRLKALGVPVVYYVSPQVWAWRRGRIRTIRETVEEMLVILPFEREFYEREGVKVRYVGHPLVDLVRASEDREAFFARLGLDRKRPLVMMLPGSRRREIELHLPILRRAIDELSRVNANLQFVVSRARTIPPELLAEFLMDRLGVTSDRVRILEGTIYDGLAHAAAAVVASGSATVEAALSGTPMVVVYRVGRTSYFLGKPFVKLPFYSMVNLIAERELVPELMQSAMTPANIVEHVMRLLDEDNAQAMRHGLADVKQKLGGEGASARAAEAVLSHFELS